MASAEAPPGASCTLEAVYDTAAFRMYCMKVLPCPQHFSHDWTECPFAHPGERATRRAPHKYGYTGVACPSMKRDGSCAIGSHCPYSHNVFEYWLHPTRYRTQLCSDGTKCPRKICFFAHSLEELRTPENKPWVAPDAVVAAAAAAAAERERRPQAAAGPASPRGQGLQADAAETEAEEQQRIVELATWLLSKGRFSAEQAATLLRHLLLPGALATLTTGLRGGQGGGASASTRIRDATAPVCHSDPLGLHPHSSSAASAGRRSLDSAQANAFAPHPALVATGPAQQAQQSQQAMQQPQAAATSAGELAAVASHLAAVAEAQRMLDAALAAAVAPASPAGGPPLGPSHARFSAPAAHTSLTPSPRRASLDARQEARLCAGYATVRLQQAAALPHAAAGHSPQAQLQQQLPPHWQSLVHAGAAYDAPYQYEDMLPANSWPAAAAPSPAAAQAAALARASMDSCFDSGLFYSIGSAGAGSEAGLPRVSVDSRHSMDASLARYSVDGRPSVDSTSMAALAMDRLSQEVSRLSQDLGRMSFEAAARPLPPPTANPYASSLFASGMPGPSGNEGAWQAGGPPHRPA
ncbi:hypothetical protein ABPG75_008345 [Micractinium tetrahymenae]